MRLGEEARGPVWPGAHERVNGQMQQQVVGNQDQLAMPRQVGVDRTQQVLRERSRDRLQRRHLTPVDLRSVVLPREVNARALVEMATIARDQRVELRLRHGLALHLEASARRHHEDVQGVRRREVLDRERSRGQTIGELREGPRIHDLLVDELRLVLRIPFQEGVDLAKVFALGARQQRREALDPLGALIARAPGQLLEQGTLDRQGLVLLGPRVLRSGADSSVLELRPRSGQRFRGHPSLLGFKHGPGPSIVSRRGILQVQLEQQGGQGIVGLEPMVSVQVLLTGHLAGELCREPLRGGHGLFIERLRLHHTPVGLVNPPETERCAPTPLGRRDDPDDLQAPLVQQPGGRDVAGGQEHVRPGDRAGGHGRVLEAEGLRPDPEPSLGELPGGDVVAFQMQQVRQRVERGGHVRMLGSQRLFAHEECALEKRAGGSVVSHVPHELTKGVEAGGHIGMRRPEHAGSDLQRSLMQGARGRVVSGRMQELGKQGVGRRHVGMTGAMDLLREDETLLEQRPRARIVARGPPEEAKVVQAGRHVGMNWSQDLGADLQGPLEHRPRVAEIAQGLPHEPQIVEPGGHVGVDRPERLLPDREGALVERLRRPILTHSFMEPRQVVEALRDAGMRRPQRRLTGSQRTLIQRPCRCIVAAAPVEAGQVVDPRGHVQVVRAQDGFPDGDRPLEERQRARVVAGGLEKHAEIVEALGHVAMHGPERLLADPQRLSRLGDAFSVVAIADVLNGLRVQSTGVPQRVLPGLGRLSERLSGRHYGERQPDGEHREPCGHCSRTGRVNHGG